MQADVLVIGGGPSGASAAIWLAEAGWQVVLVEQHSFPRQKVCGECLPAGIFPILDELGVGEEVRQTAGALLKDVGWMDGNRQLTTHMPPSPTPDAYGRALGRDVFDSILLSKARRAGVEVLQPARVASISGQAGEYHCEIILAFGSHAGNGGNRRSIDVSARFVIDAHGSWEHGPRFLVPGAADDPADQPAKPSDLFAFKATFSRTNLRVGCLPVFALNGAYGGLVVANDGRTTVALCMRRDTLRKVRMQHPGMAAGAAVEQHLLASCRGVSHALRNSARQGAWLSVGPLRPGVRLTQTPGIYRVGNAAGEAHPLVGEGMRMAVESARELTLHLLRYAVRTGGEQRLKAMTVAYSKSWRRLFASRLRIAGCYAQIAMRPMLSQPASTLLERWPGLLTTAAVYAGKARSGVRLFDSREDFE